MTTPENTPDPKQDELRKIAKPDVSEARYFDLAIHMGALRLPEERDIPDVMGAFGEVYDRVIEKHEGLGKDKPEVPE